jgi:hypothetical protein
MPRITNPICRLPPLVSLRFVISFPPLNRNIRLFRFPVWDAGPDAPSDFLRHERNMHQRHLTAGITELTTAVHSHTNRCQCGS